MDDWVEILLRHVNKKPCAVLWFEGEEWARLLESRRGVAEFTVARPHDLVSAIKAPTVCLVFGRSDHLSSAYCGVLTGLQSVTTLDTRIKIRRGFQITPSSENAVARLVTDTRAHNLLTRQLEDAGSVVKLSAGVSAAVIRALAGNASNQHGLRNLAEFIATPKTFADNAALEDDAVQMALKAFGITAADPPVELDLSANRRTALARVPMMEDSVIEHDARWFPGFTMIQSDVTGRARFVQGDEQLEIFTANKRPLEETFGVDLIYLNLTRHNIVMVQYKMLDKPKGAGEDADWVYRPDGQLREEIRRMEQFATDNKPGDLEYRLNPAVFFLKFVKRDAAIRGGGIVMPLEHYKVALKDPRCIAGERGGIRVSYKSLGGRYLREAGFLDLLRSGYIGAHAETTQNFTTLVQAVLGSNRAVVGAVESMAPPEEREPLELDDDSDERVR